MVNHYVYHHYGYHDMVNHIILPCLPCKPNCFFTTKNDLDDPPNRVIVIQHTVLFRRKHLILKDHLMINKTVRQKKKRLSTEYKQ